MKKQPKRSTLAVYFNQFAAKNKHMSFPELVYSFVVHCAREGRDVKYIIEQMDPSVQIDVSNLPIKSIEAQLQELGIC